jgi:hypothetical protein
VSADRTTTIPSSIATQVSAGPAGCAGSRTASTIASTISLPTHAIATSVSASSSAQTIISVSRPGLTCATRRSVRRPLEATVIVCRRRSRQ